MNNLHSAEFVFSILPLQSLWLFTNIKLPASSAQKFTVYCWFVLEVQGHLLWERLKYSISAVWTLYSVVNRWWQCGNPKYPNFPPIFISITWQMEQLSEVAVLCDLWQTQWKLSAGREDMSPDVLSEVTLSLSCWGRRTKDLSPLCVSSCQAAAKQV